MAKKNCDTVLFQLIEVNALVNVIKPRNIILEIVLAGKVENDKW